ncbi:hypothetical protein LCGC14_1000410 [marine sediment metagenome]|uniref:HTH merR-type domain-containing protein n=1 Tax=marine sediment metagenome TaxID=412755 RepID=A0A0F9R9B6_9ZZZZ
MDLFSIDKAAQKCGVHPDTLRRWEKEGRLKPVRTKGNHRRYCIEDLLDVRSQEKNDVLTLVNIGSDEMPATMSDVELLEKWWEDGEPEAFPDSINGKPISVHYIVKKPRPGFLLIRLGSDNCPASRSNFIYLEEQIIKMRHDPDMIIVAHLPILIEWVPINCSLGSLSLIDEDYPYIITGHDLQGNNARFFPCLDAVAGIENISA